MTPEEVALDRVRRRSRREGPVTNGAQCLVFQGSKNTNGYGTVKVGARVRTVHKLAFELRRGLLAPGEQVRHSCDNPPCWEDRHLLKGDHADNMRDMALRGRNGSLKLSDQDVRAIRAARAQGESRITIADRFGITVAYVTHIATGKKRSLVT